MTGRLAENSSRATGRSLPPRRAEVLQLLAEDLSNKEIAARLTISEPTVKKHVSALMRDFGARSRTGVVLAAYASGELSSAPKRR